MKTNFLIIIILLGLSSCSAKNNRENQDAKVHDLQIDSVIYFNPFEKNIIDLSADISNLIEDSSLELKNFLVPISKTLFDSLCLAENKNITYDVRKLSEGNSISTKYSKILFTDQTSSGDDFMKYNILGYNKIWDSYLINLELYIGSFLIIIDNNLSNVTKIKGGEPYISHDGEFFLTYYAIEEGQGYIYQIFKYDSGRISNIFNFWSPSDFIPEKFVWGKKELYIEARNIDEESNYYIIRTR